MKGVSITHRGIEDISALEIKELVKSKAEVKETVCIFPVKKIEELALLCYKGQSFIKVLYLIDFFKFKDLKEIEKNLNKINEKELNKFTKNKTFRVNCKRLGEHGFNSVDTEKLITKIFLKKLKLKVDYENPDVVFYAYIYENNFYFGIDFSDFDLSKRDYRVFLHPAALKGTIAYALLRIADYKSGDLLLDPFCGSGTINIEAALFASGFPVNYYKKEKFGFDKLIKFKFDLIDKKISNKKLNLIGYDFLLRHVKASQKNAKIAGIDKKIRFSRVEVEWLDTKLDKNSIDKIVTHPPDISKNNEKEMEKLYKEFFYQADFVLKKKGSITLISRRTEQIKKAASEYKFKLIKEREVWQGQEMFNILLFGK